MTIFDQRIALAELRGMKGPWEHDTVAVSPPDNLFAQTFTNEQGQRLPELTLDELHEAEKCLDNSHAAAWLVHLWNIRGGKEHNTLFDLFVKTTAAQRAEAVLRTIGQWKE